MPHFNPKLLDGNSLAALWKQKLKAQIQTLSSKPCLVAVLVGNDGASQSYVQFKIKDCAEIGYESRLIELPQSVSQQKLLAVVQELNEDPSVHGFIVQLPLPSTLNEAEVLMAIDPNKDVDGFHPLHAGYLMLGLKGFVPATPWGILELIRHYQIPTEGAEIVILGRSHIVGRPLSVLLSAPGPQGNATVTLVHSKSKDLPSHTLRADVLVAAVGAPGLVRAHMVKEGAYVIDVGTTRVADPESNRGWRLKGDVLFEEVAPKTAGITPVPGGVGPMTRIGLLYNTMQAFFNVNPSINP